MLSDPRVAPFTDRQAVANEVIDEFGGDDPDKFKAKAAPNNDMLNSIMGGGPPGGAPAPKSPAGMVVPPGQIAAPQLQR